MRSVLKNFRSYTTRFWLVTNDIPFPSLHNHNVSDFSNDDQKQHTYTHIGLMPQWLAHNASLATDQLVQNWTDGNVELNIVHHADMFQSFNGTILNRLEAIISSLWQLY